MIPAACGRLPHEPTLQRGQRLHHVFGTHHGALPGKHLLHQQLVDVRVPVGAAVFHDDEVIVEVGGETHLDRITPLVAWPIRIRVSMWCARKIISKALPRRRWCGAWR